MTPERSVRGRARCSCAQASVPHRSRRPRRRSGPTAGRRADRRRGGQGGAARARRLGGAVGARGEDARVCFERAIELYEASDQTHAAARVAGRLAEVMWDLGRIEDGLERMNHSFELLSGRARRRPRLAGGAAGPVPLLRRSVRARATADRSCARDGREPGPPKVLAQALTTKAVILNSIGRRQEALALVRFGLQTAIDHDRPSTALRASYNYADQLSQFDRYDEAVDIVRDALAQSRRVGNRYWELGFLGHSYALLPTRRVGRGSGVVRRAPDRRMGAVPAGLRRSARASLATVGAHRGTLADTREILERFRAMESSADVQERAG